MPDLGENSEEQAMARVGESLSWWLQSCRAQIETPRVTPALLITRAKRPLTEIKMSLGLKRGIGRGVDDA